MSKIVIAGYHGYENAGDDATLISMIRSIKNIDENSEIVVLSKNPKLTEEVNSVKAISRFNPFTILYSIITSTAVVFGGGTLIQDSTSTRSIKYYLGLIYISKFFGKKVMLYSNGIGPILNKSSRKITQKILNKVDLITLRENYAKELLEEIGVNEPEIVITADSAFTLGDMISDDMQVEEIIKDAQIPLDTKIIGVSIRSYSNDENYVEVLAKLCDYIYERYGYNILFIPFQYAKDLKISDEVIDAMESRAYVIRKRCSVSQIMNIIAKCDINICMRLHSMIFSALSNKPVLGIVYDPKVKHYLEILNQEALGKNLILDIEECIRKFDAVIDNYESISESLSTKVGDLVKNAKETEKLLKKIIKK